MQRLPRGVYTKEFREQAVRLLLEEGLSILQAGQRLSMSPKALANWVSAARRAGDPGRPTAAVDGKRTGTGPVASGSGGRDDGARYFKKSCRVLCQGITTRYALMETLRYQFPLTVLWPRTKAGCIWPGSKTYSGRIVGYAMADHLRQSLVSQALEQALQTRRPRPGLICHADRGSQYCARDCQRRLPAVRRLSVSLFKVFGLNKWLQHERDK
ncbi:MAG TPA: transposase, partial [Candidatus Competibacter sp.]|nr:transposase [Candidatus Competibacter sp.]